MKRSLILTLVLSLMFVFTANLAIAADPWFIIKGKDGVCKVIQAADKTPATVAGPFKTKEAADALREKVCAVVPPPVKK
jgi:hypothetical protein